MELEQIKQDAINEAEELYTRIGLIPDKNSYPDSYDLLKIPSLREATPNEVQKLHWTRLSANSSVGLIVE